MRARRFAFGILVACLPVGWPIASAGAESALAREALDRAVAFAGGASVYALRTLVVTAESRRSTDAGEFIVPTRTLYAFPLHVRHEITVNGRTLALASSPDGGGTAFSEDGAMPLDETTRVGLERSTMRHPLVLLKARLGRDFSAEHVGEESIEGATADIVRVRQGDNETLMSIARSDGRLIEIRYRLRDRGGAERAMKVAFDRWTPSAGGGVVYPQLARGFEDGKKVFDVTTTRVETNVELAATLFSAGFGQPSFVPYGR
jgi:hypothetical protein